MSDTTLPARRTGGNKKIAGWVGLAILAFWLLVAVVGPALAPHDAGTILRLGMFSPMSRGAPLGTDYLGRDMLSRIILGARYTVGCALVASLLACVIGTTTGIFAAVAGGWIDAAISRTADALISIPHLMFALVVVAALGPSLPVLIGLIGVTYAPGAFRTSRSLAVNVNAMEFIEVARARGEGRGYIVLAEILPNMMPVVLADFGLRFVFAVLLLSGLSFLGLGIQPPNADWGALVRENIEGIYEVAPAVIVPAIAIATLTIGVNLLIDSFSGRGPGMEA